MGNARQADFDRVADLDLSLAKDDGHDAGQSRQLAGALTARKACEQGRVDLMELFAGIAETRQFDLCLTSESQPRCAWKAEQIDAFGQDILPDQTGADREPLFLEFAEEFRMQEVDLSQVWLGRIDGHARSMLNRLATMRITLDAESCEQT